MSNNGTADRSEISAVMERAKALAEADRVANDGFYRNAPYAVQGYKARVRYYDGRATLVLEQPVTQLDSAELTPSKFVGGASKSKVS